MINLVSDKPHYENVPFEIPESWEWVKLDELASYKKGPFGSSLTKAMFVPESLDTFKVYEQKNAIQKDVTLGNYFISKEHLDKLKGFEVQPNDIIVSCAGTIGETYVMPLEMKKGIINQALMYVRLHLASITPFYLIYFDTIIKSESNSDSKGTAIKNIPPFEVLKNYFFPLPPLAEQQRIVAEVEKWFALIDELEANKEDLKEYIKQVKSKVLDLAIHGKLVPQDPNDEPAIELLKRINPNFKPCDTSHYENLPQGWCACHLNQVTNIARGGSPRPIKDYITTDANGINWIKIGDTEKNGKYINETKEKIKPEGVSRSRMIYKGDFLLTNSMSFGRPYISNIEGCIHDGWLVISPINNIYNKEFLYYLLSSSYAYNQFSEKASGTAVSNLNVEKVANALFPLPPLDEQKRIAECIETIFASLDTITAEL